MPKEEQTDPVVKMDADLIAKRTAAEPKKEEPVEINNESQFFMDDHLVAHLASFHRRINQPRKKQGAILFPKHDWEGHSLVYGSIVEHEGEYRLYYKGTFWSDTVNYAQYKEKYGYGKYPICMARSVDGLSFSQEAVEGAVHEGTNIVIDDQIDDFTIAKDPDAQDDSARFKLLSSRGNWWDGLTPATSPDGIRWTWGEPHAVAYFGDRCSYWYDPVRKKHIAWSRNYQILGGRHIFHKETEDFDNWGDIRKSHPKLVISPDRRDHPMTQFYGGYGFRHRSIYIAYLEVYYIHHQRLDTQLCCSRDGVKWQRLCERDVFLPNGPHGGFDAYWIVPTFNPPIIRDGEMLIHYNGRPDPHSQPGFGHIPPGMGGEFGLSTLREDGFVSLDSLGSEGVVETKPLKLPAQRSVIEVNACPFNRRPGYQKMRLEVDIMGKSGDLMESYAIEAGGDSETIWHRVQPEKPLPETVKLRFRGVNTRLYSFRIV